MFLRSLTEHSHSNWQHTQFVWWGEDEGGLFPGHSQFLSHMAGSQWVVPRDHRNLQHRHRPRYSVSGLSPGIIATCSMNADLVIQSVGCHLQHGHRPRYSVSGLFPVIIATCNTDLFSQNEGRLTCAFLQPFLPWSSLLSTMETLPG